MLTGRGHSFPEGVVAEQNVGATRPADHEETFLLAQVNVLLRWRRTILVLGMIGGLVGLASGLLKTRVYRSSATFLTQSSDLSANMSGLALAASQFGVRLPT